MKHILLSSIIGASLLTASSQAEENLLKNGNFPTKSAQPWKIFGIKQAEKPTVSINNGEITLSVKVPAQKVANRQMTQGPIQLKSSTKYKLTFDAKSAKASEEIQVFLPHTKNHKAEHYGLRKKITLTTEWQPQTAYFTTKVIDPNDPPTFKFLVGNITKSVSLRNIVLTPAKGGKK